MRERLAAIALYAYPATVRMRHGGEMLGTLLDASNASDTRFAREIADLIRVGLRTRATQTASVGPARILADGFCRGAILVMMLDLSTLLAQKFERGYEDRLLAPSSIAMLLVLLGLALVGYERLAGIGGLIWTAARIPELIGHQPAIGGGHLAGLAPTVVPILCFVVLLIAPRHRGLDVRRLAWLAVVAALVLGLGPHGAAGPFFVVVVIGAVLTITAAILTLGVDPRLAIGCALPATYVGLMVIAKPNAPMGLPTLLTAAAPLVIAAALMRTHRLRVASPPAKN